MRKAQDVGSIVRFWVAAAAIIAIVFGSLAYSANDNPYDAIFSRVDHDFIPPFRG